jgi:hypothetical protein
MRLYRFDQAVGRLVTLHASRFTQAALTGPEGGARAVCFHLPPGDGGWVWAAPGGPGG